MFTKKQAKYILEFQIDFNLSEISKWLEDGGDIDNLGKEKPDWHGGFGDNRKYPVINSYIIDVLPLGQGVDAYYHRKAGKISNNVGGIDFLNNASEDIRLFCERNKISVFKWETWRGHISASVNEKIAIIVPLEKFVELQLNERLSNKSFVGTKLSGNEQIQLGVPIAFNQDGSVKETAKVWHSTASSNSIGYMNEIVSISAHTLNFEVEY